ncbi:hypothetical protein BTVI_05534 [Pitangus sulphuratus]|nr:hypothetical protein BTVI_05534 [Pitangus sulphuratus]
MEKVIALQPIKGYVVADIHGETCGGLHPEGPGESRQEEAPGQSWPHPSANAQVATGGEVFENKVEFGKRDRVV